MTQHVVDKCVLLCILLLFPANAEIQVHGNRPQKPYNDGRYGLIRFADILVCRAALHVRRVMVVLCVVLVAIMNFNAGIAYLLQTRPTGILVYSRRRLERTQKLVRNRGNLRLS